MKITTLSTLLEVPVSHDPLLKKKVMVQNGEIPHLTGFSQAVIPVGGSVSPHTHTDMFEVFLVSQASGRITVQGTETYIETGSCIVIEPNEEHSLLNTGTTNLVLTYFGIV